MQSDLVIMMILFGGDFDSLKSLMRVWQRNSLFCRYLLMDIVSAQVEAKLLCVLLFPPHSSITISSVFRVDYLLLVLLYLKH